MCSLVTFAALLPTGPSSQAKGARQQQQGLPQGLITLSSAFAVARVIPRSFHSKLLQSIFGSVQVLGDLETATAYRRVRACDQQ